MLAPYVRELIFVLWFERYLSDIGVRHCSHVPT